MKRKLILSIFLLLCVAGILLAATSPQFILQFQNAGTTIGTWLNYIKINCSTGLTCTASGSTVTMTASGGGSGTVSANNGSANELAIYTAASGSTTVSADSTLIDSGTILTYSGTGAVLPNGTSTNPSLAFANSTQSGFYSTTAGSATFLSAGTAETFMSAAKLEEGSALGIGWGSGAASTALQTAFWQVSSGIAELGQGTSAASSGTLELAGLISVGTKFTSSGGLDEGSLVGGATAGSFTTATVTSGSTTITVGNATTNIAPHGWSCWATDVTHPTDLLSCVSASTTTFTITVSSAITAGDVITFGAIGY